VSPKRLHLAFVMDPIESVDIEADTTFALMLEAQRRGHHVFSVSQADLGVSDEGPTARIVPVELRREKGRHADLGEPRTVALDAEIDAIFDSQIPRSPRFPFGSVI